LSSDKKLVAVSGFDSSAIPIEIVSKSLKDFKLKSHSLEDFTINQFPLWISDPNTEPTH
jgi:hypothetical protein